jgi:hypothetical protein
VRVYEQLTNREMSGKKAASIVKIINDSKDRICIISLQVVDISPANIHSKPSKPQSDSLAILIARVIISGIML